jgi:hypothetical protein
VREGEGDAATCGVADGAEPADEIPVFWIAALVNVDEDPPGAAAPGAPTAPATLAPVAPGFTIAAVDSVVWRVDPAPAGAAAIAPMFGNDPAPQRH